MERQFELLLFAMRWLLAPLYLGLGLLLIMFAVQFFRELIHIFETATSLLEVDLILASLTLIDLTLVASLVVMVMLSATRISSPSSTSATRRNRSPGWASSTRAR